MCINLAKPFSHLTPLVPAQMSDFDPEFPATLYGGDDELLFAAAATPETMGATTTVEERDEAAAMRRGGGAAANAAGDNTVFLAVDIDVGTFKYVLIETTNPTTGTVHYLVRGNIMAEYHKDAARSTVRELDAAGWPYTVLGGGRISHDNKGRKILVYGHSYGFPWKVRTPGTALAIQK